jgi:ribosomal protein S18 acetylase RimI-like enzyme
MTDNLKRMLQLVDEVFDVKNDPSQLNVTQKALQRLQRLHPATLQEADEGEGPVAWILVIPTTTTLMQQFLGGAIGEQQLVDKTKLGGSYNAVYLCSATVLPEYRHAGLAKRLMVNAIKDMMATHPIEALFYWPFTPEGSILAAAAARELSLPLMKREIG